MRRGRGRGRERKKGNEDRRAIERAVDDDIVNLVVGRILLAHERVVVVLGRLDVARRAANYTV